jgi:2-dehydropantoate 2-reductase
MKVLVIGRGVVGTIYGWALSKAGIDVTHVVRKEGLPDTDTLDLLDLRPRYSKNKRVSYAPKTVAQINPSDGFELVIVATKHYQAAQAIHQYLPGASGATFLLFTANWDGPGEIDRLLPRSSILWAYAAASGGPDDRGILVATVNPTVRFGMLEGSDPEKFKAVTGLFQRAGFSLDIKPNIIEWLWAPRYQCWQHRNLPLGGRDRRSGPEFHDLEAGNMGHSGRHWMSWRPVASTYCVIRTREVF